MPRAKGRPLPPPSTLARCDRFRLWALASKIHVKAIAPGVVDTQLTSAILKDDGMLKHVVDRTPMGRYGKPEEIAGGALYLASDSATFLTGHTLVIDGGMTIV